MSANETKVWMIVSEALNSGCYISKNLFVHSQVGWLAAASFFRYSLEGDLLLVLGPLKVVFG